MRNDLTLRRMFLLRKVLRNAVWRWSCCCAVACCVILVRNTWWHRSSFPAATSSSCYTGMHDVLKKRFHQIFTTWSTRHNRERSNLWLNRSTTDSLSFQQRKQNRISGGRQQLHCYIRWKSSLCFYLLFFYTLFFLHPNFLLVFLWKHNCTLSWCILSDWSLAPYLERKRCPETASWSGGHFKDYR